MVAIIGTRFYTMDTYHATAIWLPLFEIVGLESDRISQKISRIKTNCARSGH